MIAPTTDYQRAMWYLGCCIRHDVIRPATTVDREEDDGMMARCDYCGAVFPVNQIKLYWVWTHTTDDGVGVFTTGLYCGGPCGGWATNRFGTSRG